MLVDLIQCDSFVQTGSGTEHSPQETVLPLLPHLILHRINTGAKLGRKFTTHQWASDRSHTGCSCSVTWRHHIIDVNFWAPIWKPVLSSLLLSFSLRLIGLLSMLYELCCLSSVLIVVRVALMLILWTFFSRSFLDHVGGPLSVLWCHLPKLEPCSLPGVFLYSQVCWLAKLHW